MGERCSGTNFLEKAILENFEVELIWHYGYKHFFGFYDYSKKNPIIENDDEVLFLGIIREPISWINSFHNNKHHIPPQNKESIYNFLHNEFYSVNDNNQEILEDRNYKNKKKYKNIFELRNLKNEYLMNHKQRVKNYLLLRYEDLNNNYEITLQFLQKKFNLKRINNTNTNTNTNINKETSFIKIKSYKGLKNKKYFENNITLKQYTINNIKNRLNKKQEQSLGYLFD